MEQIKFRRDALVQALNTLKEVLIVFEHVDVNSEINYRIVRDSVIRRFEYCVDLLWKYLKDYLELVLKVTLEVYGPKNIIRSCSRVGLLTEQESKHIFEMIESRNMTSHMYREEIAQRIADQVPEFYELMMSIVGKTEPGK